MSFGVQGFQAAANIAPDLDVRAMPKGPLFPRWVLSYLQHTRPLIGPCAFGFILGAAAAATVPVGK